MKENRTTIIAIAKDYVNKNAFIFNSSIFLPKPNNKYKFLLDFFEIKPEDFFGRVSVIGEYKFDGFSYLIYEELPYSNYNRKDQKQINVVKKKYIDNYNDKAFPLYNMALNDNAIDSLEDRHNMNVIKLCGEIHYNELLKFYKRLEEFEQYEIIMPFLLDKNRRIYKDFSINYISKRYFEGDNEAGIELLLRKKLEEVANIISWSPQITRLEWDTHYLVNAYKHIEGYDYEGSDVQTILLATYLRKKYRRNITIVLDKIIKQSKEIITKYFEGKDTSGLEEKISFYKLHRKSKEWLMISYMKEKNIWDIAL